MLFRTHFVIVIFGMLVLINYFSFGYLFVLGVLVATVFVDIDSFSSKLGRKFFARVLMAFTKHRGIIHSLFFMGILSGFLIWFFYEFGIGFLFGYSIHLFVDCLTKRGVGLFWPLKFRVRGFVTSGKGVEFFLFVFFSILDLTLLFSKIYSKLLLNL